LVERDVVYPASVMTVLKTKINYAVSTGDLVGTWLTHVTALAWYEKNLIVDVVWRPGWKKPTCGSKSCASSSSEQHLSILCSNQL